MRAVERGEKPHPATPAPLAAADAASRTAANMAWVCDGVQDEMRVPLPAGQGMASKRGRRAIEDEEEEGDVAVGSAGAGGPSDTGISSRPRAKRGRASLAVADVDEVEDDGEGVVEEAASGRKRRVSAAASGAGGAAGGSGAGGAGGAGSGATKGRGRGKIARGGVALSAAEVATALKHVRLLATAAKAAAAAGALPRTLADVGITSGVREVADEGPDAVMDGIEDLIAGVITTVMAGEGFTYDVPRCASCWI